MIRSQSYLKSVIPRFFALILLVISLALGLFVLYVCNWSILRMLFVVLENGKIFRLVNYVLPYSLGILFIVFLIFTSEYHFNHLGKRESWALFIKTFSIQLLILILAFII